MSSPHPPSAFWCVSSQRTAACVGAASGGESVGSQRGQRRARAVDVVHAPSPEPRAIGLLLLLEPRHTGGESPRVGRGLGRQHLEHVGGDVGARWVRHLAEIAERETGAGAAGVVDVEGGPPAVAALHAFHPAHRPCDGGVDPGGVGMLDAPERQHDLCGVVHVGVVRVGELERPPAGFEPRPAHRPVAGHPHLVPEQEVGRPNEGRIVGRDPGVGERDDRDAVSHTGDWHASRRRPRSSSITNPSRPARPARDHRVIERVAAQREGEERVDPRRLDPAPRAVGFLAVEDPALGGRQGRPPQGPERPAVVACQHAVEHPEPAFGRPRRGPLPWRRRTVQLGQAERQRMHGSRGGDDRQRHDGLAGPAREVVHVQRARRREEEHLRRQRGEHRPVPLAEECEPDPGEDAGAFDAARVAHERHGFLHVVGVDGIPGQAQRGVGLDGGREIGRAFVERRPGAVGALPGTDPVGGAPRDRLGADPEELPEEQILRVHGDVGLELALPPTGRILAREERVPAPGERGSDVEAGDRSDGHDWRSTTK